ncbi:MAG TPA: hypothetical protein VF261_00935 [Candidatus Saccharimonadales bacterium]
MRFSLYPRKKYREVTGANTIAPFVREMPPDTSRTEKGRERARALLYPPYVVAQTFETTAGLRRRTTGISLPAHTGLLCLSGMLDADLRHGISLRQAARVDIMPPKGTTESLQFVYPNGDGPRRPIAIAVYGVDKYLRGYSPEESALTQVAIDEALANERSRYDDNILYILEELHKRGCLDDGDMPEEE